MPLLQSQGYYEFSGASSTRYTAKCWAVWYFMTVSLNEGGQAYMWEACECEPTCSEALHSVPQ